MPELPEVETVRRGLAAQIVGRVFTGISFLEWPRTIESPAPEDLAHQIAGHQVLAVSRRAKFLVIALAGIGLPGTSGFNGEHLIVLGAYQAHWTMAVMAGVGTFLTAAYLIRYFQRAFLGDARASEARRMPDLRPRELLIAVTLGGFIFWVGLYTTPFLQIMNGSLRAIEQRVEQGSFGGTGAAEPLELRRFEVRR